MKIEIEFISSNVLKSKTDKEKMDFILNKIKAGKILVVEESLSSLDESKLIEATMNQIDEKFRGIEVSTLRESNVNGIREKVIRFLGGKTGGLTVIGPSKLIKKIKKEPQRISLLAEVREIRRGRKWK